MNVLQEMMGVPIKGFKFVKLMDHGLPGRVINLKLDVQLNLR